MKVKDLTIGSTYYNKITDDYFIALDTDQLFTVLDRKVHIKTVSAPADFKGLSMLDEDVGEDEYISCEDLCEMWGITLGELDEITRRFLYSKSLVHIVLKPNANWRGSSKDNRHTNTKAVVAFFKKLRTTRNVQVA